MKRFWPYLVAVLALSSCTPVDDFGAYWDKGFADPALEGTWKKAGLPGEDIGNIPGADLLRFTKNGANYDLQGINPLDPALTPENLEQRRKDNEYKMSTRSLQIGKHRFLMQRDPSGQGRGFLQRYDIQGTTLREYSIENGAAVDFLETKHPEKNIRKNVGEGRYVVIKRFDDEVFQVLSEMLDTPEYWRLDCEYRKVP